MSHFMAAFRTLPAFATLLFNSFFNRKIWILFRLIKARKKTMRQSREQQRPEEEQNRFLTVTRAHSRLFSCSFSAAENIDMRINDFGYLCCTWRAFHSTKRFCATKMPQTQRNRSRRWQTRREETEYEAKSTFVGTEIFSQSLSLQFSRAIQEDESCFSLIRSGQKNKNNQPAYKFCFSET